MSFGKITGGRGRPPGGNAPTKATLLAGTKWIHRSDAIFHGITRDEIAEHWLRVNADAAADPHVDHEDLSESLNAYRRYALAMHATGWSPFPETRDDRRPALLGTYDSNDRKVRKQWSPVKPSERRDRRMTVDALIGEMDAPGIYGNNTANVIGPACRDIRVMDIDVTEPELAELIIAKALEVFGPTPFMRQGRAPKLVLIYRMEDDDLDIGTTSLGFLGADGKPDLVTDGKGKVSTRNAIEFLATGRNTTFYGLHHKTGRSFEWIGEAHPAILGPQHAPLITGDQFRRFLRECHAIRPFAAWSQSGSSPTGGKSEVSTFYTDGDIWHPKRSNGAWIVDDSGFVVDGREAYLTAMTWAYLAANPNLIVSRFGALCRSARLHIVNRVISDDSRHGRFSSSEAIEAEVDRKMVYARTKWLASIEQHARTGEWLAPAIPWKILENGERPMAQHIVGAERPADGSLDWLPEQPCFIPDLNRTEKVKNVIAGAPKSPEKLAADKAARALLDDDERAVEHLRIAGEIDAGIRDYLDTIGLDYADELPPVMVLRGPTGSGKTVRTVREVGAFAKDNPRGPNQGPIIVLMPTHDNVAEALATAERSGMIVPDPTLAEIGDDAAAAMLKANGVKAAVFKGKTQHCKRLDELKLLTEKNIGTGGLCGAEIDDEPSVVAKQKRKDGETVKKKEILCHFREMGQCEYWTQQHDVANAEIVFVSHAYLTMHSLPKVLKNARAVVIDEAITYRVLHQTLLPWGVLTTPRDAPFVTKKERAEHPDHDFKSIGETMLAARERVLETIGKALTAGKDCGQSIIDAGQQEDLLLAIKVVIRQHIDEREIIPTMTPTALAALAGRATGAHLIEEEKLLKTVADRVERILAGTARGDTDARLFLNYAGDGKYKKPHSIRISWRSEPNWPTAPVLLLDASADVDIIGKFYGRQPIVHAVSARNHLRVVACVDRPYSNRSFSPPEDADDGEKAKAVETVRQARGLISKLAGVFAHGRVLLGSTVDVRGIVAKGSWSPPPNVDQVHFGALRGLDGFKNHSAAVSFGRSEQPIAIVDGYSAALTFDDDEPEQPYDTLGTGMTAAGKPLFRVAEPRVTQLRSGHDLGVMVHMIPRPWGRAVERQWREEELNQFGGRLRAVYRDGEPPIWICVSSSLPEGFVVDELFSLKDLSEGEEFWEINRAENGVILSDDLSHPVTKRLLKGKTMREFVREAFNNRDDYYTRAVAALAKVKYVLDGRPMQARVAAWHDDPAEALQAYYGKLDRQIEVTEVEPAKLARIENAMARKPDRIDRETADLDLAAREIYLEEAAARLRETGRTPTVGMLEMELRAGVDIERLAVDLDDGLAHVLQSIERAAYFDVVGSA